MNDSKNIKKNCLNHILCPPIRYIKNKAPSHIDRYRERILNVTDIDGTISKKPILVYNKI